MKKRILVIKRVEITHAIEIEIPNENVLNEVVETLNCDKIEDFDDVISRIGSVNDAEIESFEEDYNYNVDEIEIDVVDAD